MESYAVRKILRLWKCTAVWLGVNLAVTCVLLVFGQEVTLWWLGLTTALLVGLIFWGHPWP